MKRIKLTCPRCGGLIFFKSWFSWVLHTPFNWFGKRLTKCMNCGKRSYIGRK